MPAATNKADLLAVCIAEYAKLERLIAPLSEEQASAPDDEGWSIRDVIHHRAHWAGLFLTWRAGGEAGGEVQTPAPGYKWNQLKAYNASVQEAGRERGWAQVKVDLAQAHEALMANLERSSDRELYTARLYPWMNKWTLGRWAEASGASHYRSAAKFIRKRLREM